ncbi:MAG: hypothetical protein VW474_12650, partial [Paracoccaceae bacterium]
NRRESPRVTDRRAERRGNMIAAQRPDVTIHLKDCASGPGGMAEFVVKLISTFLTNEAAA